MTPCSPGELPLSAPKAIKAIKITTPHLWRSCPVSDTPRGNMV